MMIHNDKVMVLGIVANISYSMHILLFHNTYEIFGNAKTLKDKEMY